MALVADYIAYLIQLQKGFNFESLNDTNNYDNLQGHDDDDEGISDKKGRDEDEQA